MTFPSRETSPNNGRPFHLYRFKFGPGANDVVYYTNVAMPYEFDEMLFEPLAITHGDIVSAGNLDKSALSVTLPDETEIAALYGGQPPSYVVTLTIWQGHVADDDFRVCWAGRVMGATFDDAIVELECEPIVSSLRRPGLSRDYQYACPLVLYGSRCRADREAATRVTQVAAVNGPWVTLAATWAPAGLKEKHVGGYAEWTNDAGRTERRAIIDVVGDIVQVSSFPEGLNAGDPFTVVLGCSHLMDDCRSVHNNILNFGGQPEIPLKNPVGITNNYY